MIKKKKNSYTFVRNKIPDNFYEVGDLGVAILANQIGLLSGLFDSRQKPPRTEVLWLLAKVR